MTSRNGRRADSPDGVNRFADGPFDVERFNATLKERPFSPPSPGPAGAQQLASNPAQSKPGEQMK